MANYPVDKKSFSEKEETILKFWEEENIFQSSVDQRDGAPYYTFYDGPPFATGLPHYGHLLAGTIKDVIPRYKTMKGYYVPRRFGWDCHGLPIENEIEKAHNLSGKKSIETFGIEQFNEECRKIVLRYSQEWKKTVLRMGRWVDFDNTYRTMDLPFMESVWWVFKQLWDKGLVYQGFRVMPFSAKLGTPLSNFEAGENYKEVDDPALTVLFTLEEDPDVHVIAWTTTPWTLISNLALMVGPGIPYVKIKDLGSGKTIILAENRLSAFYKTEESYEVLDRFLGEKLVGLHYRPLLPYFSHLRKEGAFRIIGEETVSTDEGTGVVHSAPAFGEVDFFACQKASIPLVCPVDNNGRFTEEISEYNGLFVKDADKGIIHRLKEGGSVFHHATCRHRYPFCWRSDTPLIYKAVSTWFVAVEKIKDALVESNKKTNWTPSHLKEGRFGKWLEGARDWNIGRNRYWGTPIPIWRNEEGDCKVIGSIKELEELTGEKVTDLHRHFIDHYEIKIDGKVYTRIEEVFDCWFESGSMPYAQNHYPFENKDFLKNHFPADFIAEGLDQTRGWFYTLMVLSTALFEKPAFKNVIVNGILLAENGTKMSKRLKNYPDPMDVIHKYSADAVRLYMLNSPAVRADDLSFSAQGVEVCLRQFIIPFWNAYAFFATYANIYDWKPAEIKEPEALIDRWILSSLHRLIHEVEEGMDQYNLQLAVDPLVAFIDRLTNWYIRRSRRRFWSSDATPDRDQAFATLHQVLILLSQVAAPFIPFLTDEIYQGLRTEKMPASVHLTDYPKYDPKVRDTDLEASMEAVLKSVNLGHGLRKEHRLKVRQPLQTAFIASSNRELLQLLATKKQLIMDELNVKNLEFSEDESAFVKLKAKPNFRVLGKKVGKRMPQLKAVIENLEQAELNKVMEGKPLDILLDGTPIQLLEGEIGVEREVKQGVIAANAQELTVALDPELTDELKMEGLAREMVNKINTMRKDHGLEVTDRIDVVMKTTPFVEESYKKHQEYVDKEVLATSFSLKPTEGTEWDLNGELAVIALQKQLV